MKKLKASNGFFMLDSVPNVQFLKGTPFKVCKQYGGTLEDYNKVNGIKQKSLKKTLEDKSLKINLKDKKAVK